MKIYNNDLFLLVKSLDPAEKRYFKMYTSKQAKGGESSYIRLFEAVDKQKEYDEKKIIDELHKKKIVDRKNFPCVKNHLYYTVLKWMNFFSSDSTPAGLIKDLIRYAEVLTKKMLYKQSEKLLLKAKVMAYEIEAYTDLIHIVNLQIFISNRNLRIKDKSKEVEKFFLELQEVAKNQNQDHTYSTINLKVYSFYVEWDPSDEKKREKLKEMAKNPLLFDNAEPASFFSRQQLFNSKSLLQDLLGNREKYHYYTGKMLELVESKPQKIRKDQRLYITSLNNHIHACMLFGKYKECLNYLQILRTLKCTTQAARSASFGALVKNELQYHLIRSEFKEGLDLAKKVEAGLKEYKGTFNRQFEYFILLMLSETYFYNKQYNKSIKWLNVFLRDADAEINRSFYLTAKLFYLVLLFETGNKQLLDTNVVSTYFYFKRHQILHDFERFFLNFMKAAINEKNDSEKLRLKWKSLKEQQKSEPPEGRIFGRFKFMEWIELKLIK